MTLDVTWLKRPATYHLSSQCLIPQRTLQVEQAGRFLVDRRRSRFLARVERKPRGRIGTRTEQRAGPQAPGDTTLRSKWEHSQGGWLDMTPLCPDLTSCQLAEEASHGLVIQGHAAAMPGTHNGTSAPGSQSGGYTGTGSVSQDCTGRWDPTSPLSGDSHCWN